MSLYSKVKRLLVGKPIASKHAHHERLIKLYGLPVFSSDAISSTAYATQEVQIVLTGAVPAMAIVAYEKLMPIAIALAILLVIVAFSYYQTIHAYPEGGGSYSVSKANLGSFMGRIAAAALLIDYVLTVSVSASAGVEQTISIYGWLTPYKVPFACLVIAFIAMVNLRGARESGVLFAIPTYSFVFFTAVLIVCGLIQGIGHPAVQPDFSVVNPMRRFHEIGFIFILRGFAAICTAMTGVEAVSNGVQAFRPPEARNASTTLVWMAGILAVMVLGVSWCAQHYGIVPMESDAQNYKSVIALSALRIFGDQSVMWHRVGFLGIQISATLILFLAANTSFADFPRLSSFIARDKFLPRQFMGLGDRLVYNNGIIVLAVVSILLVVIFNADSTSLMPLYAVGVFTAFTMSQSGMVVRWFKLRKFDHRLIINAVGALATGVVTVIIAYTKFREGAWIVVVLVVILMFLFAKVKHYYDYLAKEFEVTPTDEIGTVDSKVLLLIPRLHRGTLKAIAYAKTMAKDVRALHITLDPQSAGPLREFWVSHGIDMPLVILDSPYRSLVEPVIDYVDQALAEDPNAMITVIVPQGIPPKWYQAILHSNLATALKIALGNRRNVVITNVRYFL